MCFGERVLVPTSEPLNTFEFSEIGVRGLGISTWFSWSQVIHSRPGEKWCAMWEPLQDFASQIGKRVGNVGSALWGRLLSTWRVPQSLHNGPFPTAPSRLIPSAHGEFLDRADRASLVVSLLSDTTDCRPTAHLHTRKPAFWADQAQGSQLVGAHVGRWSTQKIPCQAQIDPSKKHWRVRIATRFLPLRSSFCEALSRSREILSLLSSLLH